MLAAHDNICFLYTDLESAEDLYHRRITRIITQDFPKYFAIITRLRQEVTLLGPDGGIISSTVVPQVQAVFPPGALTKKIKLSLQVSSAFKFVVLRILCLYIFVSVTVTMFRRACYFVNIIQYLMFVNIIQYLMFEVECR